MYTSQTNPIIASVRSLIEDGGGVIPDRSAFWLNCARYLCSGTHAMSVPITRSHKDHARAVFLRLGALDD